MYVSLVSPTSHIMCPLCLPPAIILIYGILFSCLIFCLLICLLCLLHVHLASHFASILSLVSYLTPLEFFAGYYTDHLLITSHL